MVASQMVAFTNGFPDGIVSLGVGLWGVVLARWVFVNRENRRLPRRQELRETLPLTLVAMLITGVVVHDQNFGLSAAAFTGLGVGWAAVLLLDILGERIVAAFRAGFAMPVAQNVKLADISGEDGMVRDTDVDLPEEMLRSLERLDHYPGQKRITDQTDGGDTSERA